MLCIETRVEQPCSRIPLRRVTSPLRGSPRNCEMVRSRLAALKLEPSQADAGHLSGSGTPTRWLAVSKDECITLSNGRSLLVSDGGGGDGPVSVDGAGESGDLASIPGGCVAAVDQSDAGTHDGGAADARGGDRRAPTAGAAPVRTMAGAGGPGRDLPWDRGGAFMSADRRAHQARRIDRVSGGRQERG